jgi:hypothetical protein
VLKYFQERMPYGLFVPDVSAQQSHRCTDLRAYFDSSTRARYGVLHDFGERTGEIMRLNW